MQSAVWVFVRLILVGRLQRPASVHPISANAIGTNRVRPVVLSIPRFPSSFFLFTCFGPFGRIAMYHRVKPRFSPFSTPKLLRGSLTSRRRLDRPIGLHGLSDLRSVTAHVRFGSMLSLHVTVSFLALDYARPLH